MSLEIWKKVHGKQSSAKILNKTLTLRRQIRKTSRRKCMCCGNGCPYISLTNMENRNTNTNKTTSSLQISTNFTETPTSTNSMLLPKTIVNTNKRQTLLKMCVNKLNKNKFNKINPSVDYNAKQVQKITKCYLNHNWQKNREKSNFSVEKNKLIAVLSIRKSHKNPTTLRALKPTTSPINCGNSSSVQLNLKLNEPNTRQQKQYCLNTLGKNIKISVRKNQQQKNSTPAGNAETHNKSRAGTESKAWSAESICGISATVAINLTATAAGNEFTTTSLSFPRATKRYRSSSAAALSFYTKWWPFSTSATFWSPKHLLSSMSSSYPSPVLRNTMFRGLLITLLVLFSICQYGVLETSAASLQTSNDVIASVMELEKMSPSPPTLQTTKTTTFELATNHKTKDQHKELLTSKPTEQQIFPQSSALPQQIVYDRTIMDAEQKEKPTVTSTQPESLRESLLPAKQKRGQQLQQYLTSTQETSFNANGLPQDSVDRKALESLSIAEGGLMLPMDVLRKAQQEKKQREGGDYDHNKKTAGGDMSDEMMPFQKRHTMPVFDFSLPQNITARTGHMEASIKCRVDRIGDKSVSWIRKRDLHILSVGKTTYTSDKRYHVTESKDSREWTLHVRSPQARDSGIYECQVNTEPKMSLAFQLNIIEISPNSNALITGPIDLYVKVGSLITLTCLVRQPSIKDIGPIHWYRSEHLLTPFGASDKKIQENYFVTAAALTSKSNSVDHHSDTDMYDIIADDDEAEDENVSQTLKEEITEDFRERVELEQQLCDTIKSRLRISNAQKSDSGNYTCQPTTASSASVMVHVINEENPAAMQKSGAAAIQSHL